MRYRIGIDAGGTKVAYGLFDEKNVLVDRFQHPTPITADGPAFCDLVIESLHGLLRKNALEMRDLQGVGICMPSFILFDEGYVCMTSAMVNIRDFAMRDYLQERLNVPVVLDNDSNVAALAEHRYGAGQGSRHMVYVATSTGIGSGLILNGELFRGSYGWAGECGHMLITPDAGLDCGCRNSGCFMSWASGRYIPQHIRRMAEGRQTSMDLGPELACVALYRACCEVDFRLIAYLRCNIASHVDAGCAHLESSLPFFGLVLILGADGSTNGHGLGEFPDALLQRTVSRILGIHSHRHHRECHQQIRFLLHFLPYYIYT